MMETTQTKRIRIEVAEKGELWRVTLDSPKGNILDSVMCGELCDVFTAAKEDQNLKAVLLTAAGKHFSFGASVEEHRPKQVEAMLQEFHDLFRRISLAAVPVLSAVRGMCLGGGLELVAFSNRVFAHSEAMFGQPEISLGVFAPVGSLILPERVGRGHADDLLLSGRTVGAGEALSMGLIDAVEDDPESSALTWFQEHLQPKSASSMRIACRAARSRFLQGFGVELAELERLYLNDLMSTGDAVEGVEAFLAKRKPTWSNS